MIIEYIKKDKNRIINVLYSMPALLFILTVIMVLPGTVISKSRYFAINGYYDVIKSIMPAAIVLFVAGLILDYKRVIKKFKSKTHLLFCLCCLWAIVAVFVSGINELTFFGDEFRHEGIFQYCIWYFGIMFCSCSLIDSSSIKNKIVYFFLLCSIILSIYGIYHHYVTGDWMVSEDFVSSVYTQHNHYGYVLAMVIMFASSIVLYEKNKLKLAFLYLILILNVITLNLNNTFGAWLACVFGYAFVLIVYFLKDRRINKKIFIPFVIFILITIIMSIFSIGFLDDFVQFLFDFLRVVKDPKHNDDAGTTRWILWKTTFGYIKQKPIFGWGIEAIDEMLDIATGSSRTHNEYLQYAVTFGIPYAILYVVACYSVFIKQYKGRNKLDGITIACLTVAFTYLVSATFGITLYSTAPYLFIFLGLGFRNQDDVL